jgi:hypothetical protein
MFPCGSSGLRESTFVISGFRLSLNVSGALARDLNPTDSDLDG